MTTKPRKLIQIGVFIDEEEVLTRIPTSLHYHNLAEYDEVRNRVMERVLMALSITEVDK